MPSFAMIFYASLNKKILTSDSPRVGVRLHGKAPRQLNVHFVCFRVAEFQWIGFGLPRKAKRTVTNWTKKLKPTKTHSILIYIYVYRLNLFFQKDRTDHTILSVNVSLDFISLDMLSWIVMIDILRSWRTPNIGLIFFLFVLVLPRTSLYLRSFITIAVFYHNMISN